MSEPAEARGFAAPPIVQVPVDLVEFEARLLAIERRLREQEARDQLLLGVAEAVRRLTEALRPLLEVVGPLVESSPEAPAPDVVSTERLALAHARVRQTAAPGPAPPPPSPPPPASAFPAPGRRSWLLRVLRRMVDRDPEAAGRLLLAVLPAHRLAQIDPVPQLPGPPATVARVVVKGGLRRRLHWEMAQLACEPRTVSALARLARLRASPAKLHAAGVRVDPPLALALVAFAIDPRWTLGHRFTVAHLDGGAAYLQVRDGARPSVSTEMPAGPVTTTVHCSADVLLPLLAGAPGVVATVEGERRALGLVQGWFGDATSA